MPYSIPGMAHITRNVLCLKLCCLGVGGAARRHHSGVPEKFEAKQNDAKRSEAKRSEAVRSEGKWNDNTASSEQTEAKLAALKNAHAVGALSDALYELARRQLERL